MQEMNYQGGYRDEPPAAPVYEGVPPPLYNNNVYNSGPSGQKLSGFARSNIGGPSAGQRLTLAIVSLIFWMGMFLFVTFGVVTTFSSSLSSVPQFLISIMLVFGMLLFTGLVIFLNTLFNRSKR